MNFIDEWISVQNLFHCIFYIFVSQTVDDRIQHWNHNSVKCGHYHVMFQGIVGTGSHKHEKNCPMINGHSCEVRSTGREDFSPPFSRTHLKNCKEYETIRYQDNQNGNDLNETHTIEEQKLVYMCVRTRNSKQWRNITEDMSNYIACTERKAKSSYCVCSSMNNSTCIGS